MSSFRRNTSNRLPEGVVLKEVFLERVDKMLERDFDDNLGVAFCRISNMGNYRLLEGTQAADEVLASFLAAVVACVGRNGLVARESELAYLVLTREQELMALAKNLRDVLGQLDEAARLQLKVGFCHLDGDYDARGALERARFAFDDIEYDPKETIRVLDRRLCFDFDLRHYVLNHLDDAIERGEIKAYAQPIVRVITGRICEVEILSRWDSERFGLIAPDSFVSLLERSRQIHKLDATVIRLACKQWREARDRNVCVPFGINLSRLDFELCDIYAVVRNAMREYDVPIDQVHIELTESAMASSSDLLTQGVNRFHNAGFKLYMDDYGTGYSSLDGLRNRVYDVIKLDKSLIDDLEENERSRVIVADAFGMIKRLGMQTLCEGVETLEQLRFLRMVGCEKAQGYFFGKPTDHEHVMELLIRESERPEEADLGAYLDTVGRVNLVDGSRADVQGVEAAVFMGVTPVAVVEVWAGRLYLLAGNIAFTAFLHAVGMSSFEEMVSSISSGTGELRKRIDLATQRAKHTGKRQNVDFMAGGFFSTVGIEHLASTASRDAYLVSATRVSSSDALERQRGLESASPFLYSIYKRIDLFDLETGTSNNLYLNEPLLRSHRMAGFTIDEISEYCDRNVHPNDRVRFMDFYDLSTLDERIRQSGTQHISDVIRTRISPDKYAEHIYTLIPMSIQGHRKVLSTLRPIDVGTSNNFQISGDARISDATLLQAVLEGTDRYVFWKDDQRRFLGANQAFLDYYGFKSLDEILGKTDEEVGWHDDNEPFREDEMRVLNGEVVLRARGNCYDRNELRKIEANKRPIMVAGEIVGLLGYFRDLGPTEEEWPGGA